MSCVSPRCAFVPDKGGRPVFLDSDYPVGPFVHPSIGLGRIVYIPCGHCLECQVARRQDVTMLQCLEASLYVDNWFITLTYDSKVLGHEPTTLVKSHVSDFLQAVRKYLSYRGREFRYYGCGEYGDTYGRPHYHMSVFGLAPEDLGLTDCADLEKLRRSALNCGKIARLPVPLVDVDGKQYWQSKLLADYWPYGGHRIYRANRDTFQYVAGYVTKKLYGSEKRMFEKTGKVAPYSFQCRPSVGYPWFRKYHNCISQYNPLEDDLENDFISVDGVSWRCPRIFDKWMRRDLSLGGEVRSDFIRSHRVDGCPSVPDRADLLRKKKFARYRAEHFKQNNTHKEIK